MITTVRSEDVLKGYKLYISKATGITEIAMLKRIEEYMREVIFHSTLDWQNKREFNKGARDALALILYEDRVRAYEAKGMTTSDAQGVVDAEILKGEWNPNARTK